jgi:hypoxanthine phosphoribosyltransferase
MCQESAQRILDEFNPNVMIAIGGGGFVPARILRTFLKRPGAKNIPIVAIGLSLYEDIPQHTGPEEEAGVAVVRTQWLDFSTIGGQDLIGKRVLIVDEVDDTRTVLPPLISFCFPLGARSLIITIDVELCGQGVGEGCC